MDYLNVLTCVNLVGPLLSPVSLIALSRLSPVWYMAVKHVYPDFNLRASLRSVMGEHVDALLEAGCFIFGSTLVHAMHYTPGSEKPELNDVDLFYPVRTISGLSQRNLFKRMVWDENSDFIQELVKNHKVKKINGYFGWRSEQQVATFQLENSGKKCYDLNLIQIEHEKGVLSRINTIINTSYYDMQRNYCFLSFDGSLKFKSFSLYSHFTRIATYTVEFQIDSDKLKSYSKIFKGFKFDLTSPGFMMHVGALRERISCTFTLQDTHMILHL